MRIPRKVVVSGDIYEVRFKADLGENTLGLCDGDTHTIWIKTGLSKRDRWATFLHELLHAIEYSYKTSIPHSVIHALDTKLAEVLFDNWLSAS